MWVREDARRAVRQWNSCVRGERAQRAQRPLTWGSEACVTGCTVPVSMGGAPAGEEARRSQTAASDDGGTPLPGCRVCMRGARVSASAIVRGRAVLGFV